MINSTSLKHPTMQAKLFAAMQHARLSSLRGTGGQIYVKNKNGWPIMRVKHTRGIGGGFTFNTGNTFICNTVKHALRSA